MADALNQCSAQSLADVVDNLVPHGAIFSRYADFKQFVMAEGAVDFLQHGVAQAVLTEAHDHVEFVSALTEGDDIFFANHDLRSSLEGKTRYYTWRRHILLSIKCNCGVRSIVQVLLLRDFVPLYG